MFFFLLQTLKMNDNNITETTPITEFSVNPSDPWTISAISLLSILSLVAFYRLYYILFKSKGKIGNNNTVEVTRVKVQPKSANSKTRAQMRYPL